LIEVIIGPSDNVTGVTPDFENLAEWIASNPVTDLVAAQQKCFVYLLPGEIVDTELVNLEANTSEDYFFTFLPYGNYKFVGDFRADCPKLRSSFEYLWSYGFPDYSEIKNIAFVGSTVGSYILVTTGYYSVVDGCGWADNFATPQFGSMSLFYTAWASVRNCIFFNNWIESESDSLELIACGNYQGMVSNCLFGTLVAKCYGAGEATVRAIDGSGLFVVNNLIFDLFAWSAGGATSSWVWPNSASADWNACNSLYSTAPDFNLNHSHTSIDVPFWVRGPSPATFDPRLRRVYNVAKKGIDVRLIENNPRLEIPSDVFPRLIDYGTDIKGEDRGTYWNIGPDDFVWPCRVVEIAYLGGTVPKVLNHWQKIRPTLLAE
jgi:hypothetical protein